MEVSYEWDLETTDEHGDVQDHDHATELEEIWRHVGEPNTALVLVRDHHEDGSLVDREWAYVDQDSMQLPPRFDGGSKVPQRFHNELGLLRDLRSASE